MLCGYHSGTFQIGLEYHDGTVIVFQPYMAQARANKEVYEAAMLAWEKEMIAEGRPELVRGYRAPKPAKKVAKKTAKKTVKKVAKSKKKATKKPASKKKSTGTQTEEEDTTWMREE